MARVISFKQQKMYDALMLMSICIGSNFYCLRVPKNLYMEYKKAEKREADGKKLSAMEKTRLYGYLNPRYRAATSPKKRIH